MESALAELHQRAAHNECLTGLLELYGGELHGFIRARTNDGDADESYSAVCAALVEALPRFQRRSTFRTWMYQVARFTLSHLARARPNHVPLSQISDSARLMARRSEPPSHLGEAAEARLLELRAALDEEDRELLYLRVDRGLEWLEIAEILGDDGDANRKSAALRKRFERLKARIRDELRGSSYRSSSAGS